MDTATKERPILFSGPMVRAILEGKKTQTRRVVKPQPTVERHRLGHDSLLWRDKVNTPLNIGPDCLRRFCPYGTPGNRLWVRETWAVDAPLAEVRSAREDVMGGSFGASVYYRANPVHEGTGLTWRPSIHMPRWASRITLEVTGVRVESVQAISNAGAEAEGVAAWARAHCSQRPRDELQPWAYFQLLWDSINKPRGFGWEANPWVWVVEFRRIGSEAAP